jgi:hypothetical protein
MADLHSRLFSLTARFPFIRFAGFFLENPMNTKTNFRPLTLETSTAVDISTRAPHHNANTRFTPLAVETRTVIDTNAAAFHLGRRPQTLRKWACHEDGPLRPVRIMGRLAWNVAEIRRIVSEGSAA